MPCVKTGCHIWIEPYQEFAYGDAFEIEPILPEDHMLWHKIPREERDKVKNTAYFNLVHAGREPINGFDHVHYIVHNYDNWFGMHTQRQFLITNNFTRVTKPISEL